MNFLKYKQVSLIIAFCLLRVAAVGQVDTIKLENNRLNTAVLKPGLNQYLVYFQTPSANKALRFWFWLRDIKKGTRNSEKVFTITQHWYGADTSAYRYVYSINRAADFSPVYHKEIVRNKINAFNWNGKKIIGADSVAQNTRKDFAFDFKLPNFNWNLDIETFEMLPLATGKSFAINFYDAGLDPPSYIIYKVTGSEILTTLNNQKVDCWKLYTEGSHDGANYSETYWISKKKHEFLKEEDSFNGMFRYKIKLMGSASNLLERFTSK